MQKIYKKTVDPKILYKAQSLLFINKSTSSFVIIERIQIYCYSNHMRQTFTCIYYKLII